MSPSIDVREIGDIGDTVLSFSEAKALATNNPMLMDKAAADAQLARLVRAERAHHRTQDTLRRTITRHEQRIAELNAVADDLDSAIARRQDTRGDAFTMTVDGQARSKRADAGSDLLTLLRRESAAQLGYRQRTRPAGELGGLPLTATIGRTPFGEESLVTLAFDGAPGTELSLSASDLASAEPAGLISRLENRLARLEALKAQARADVDGARREIDHATASLGKPFPQAAELTTAIARVHQIDEQLQAAATAHAEAEPCRPTEPVDPTAAQDQREAMPARSASLSPQAGPEPACRLTRDRAEREAGQ